MGGIKGLVVAVFAIGAIVQALLYYAILAEHKRTASRARFAIMRMPRMEDLTPRGQILARWWWRATAMVVAAFAAIILLRLLS